MTRVENQSQVSAWSRRRAAVRAEAEADVKEAAAEIRADVQAQQADKSDADILRELSLQDPDQMVAGDDFSAFLRDEVPQRLQRRALRALWRSNPVLACVDDLLDYGDDFKAEGMGVGAIRTAYQVGKGMLAHVDEMQKQAASEGDISEPDVAAAGSSEEETTAVETIADTSAVEVAVVPDEAAQEPEAIAEPSPQITPRRMRFEFEETT